MVGQVREISARATTIETRDAVSVVVPNSEFVSNRVVNWTLGADERVRTQVRVGVAYGSDVALVEQVLMEVAEGCGGVLRFPEPAVHLEGFNDSALTFALHVWTNHIRALPELVSDLNKSVDQAFRARGIEIPFPQRTVHVKAPSGEEPETPETKAETEET